MDDLALRRTHDHRFRFLDRRQSRIAVAAGDRFLDFADRIAQQRAARLVDFGLAHVLARGFTGGTGIGHESLVYGLALAAVQSARRHICTRKRGGENARRHEPWLIVRPRAGVNA